MLLSIANTTPRNIEAVRTNDLLPQGIQANAKTLVELLEYYYDYINGTGLPSAEIGSISSLKDVDFVSQKYLGQIEELIGKSIPNSTVINQVELYKIIVKYYNTRGSEDSIHTFFKIFFDEIVKITYPKEHLFDLSGGKGSWVGDAWEYENHKSFPSDDYKIFDGYFWQDYSYVVRTDLDSSLWYDAYRKFVHPAGLKMFSAIAIEIILRNEWFNELDYTSADIESDDLWMKAFIPPHNQNSSLFGFHTPKYQPGYLRDLMMKYIFTYLIPGNHDTELLRLVLLSFKYVIPPVDVRTSFVRSQYQASEKFIDSCKIGEGWLSKVIGEADEPYSVTNSCKIYNISSFIGGSLLYDYSFYDVEFGAGDGDWDGSSFDEAGGTGSGDWAGSSYENL